MIITSKMFLSHESHNNKMNYYIYRELFDFIRFKK